MIDRQMELVLGSGCGIRSAERRRRRLSRAREWFERMRLAVDRAQDSGTSPGKCGDAKMEQRQLCA